MRALPNWIDAYLDYTEKTEPRKSYRLWAGLSTIAAVLQRKCYMRVGSEIFYPNLYVVLTGPPAARPTNPALSESTERRLPINVPEP